MKVILVDDHQIVRDGIKSLIEGYEDIKIIGEAGNAQELFKILNEKTPDIIILDISLPDINGLDVTQKLKQKYPNIKILILTMYNAEDYIFNAIKSGANGFLPKNTSKEELITAIRQIHSGQDYFGKEVHQIIFNKYVTLAKEEGINFEKKQQLSNRELEILRLFAEGYSNKEIADKLFISVRTVESHKNNIMQKFNFKNSVEMIKFAIKNGIVKID